ncbi:hypothetical protein ABZ791_31250 [Streptomyces huasconensis]|uniref:Uncharacterized protein n=1 Tax=Streptomyces huasconensis TaxID=1854574 RepID=A0ABV3LZ92_9ACTN
MDGPLRGPGLSRDRAYAAIEGKGGLPLPAETGEIARTSPGRPCYGLIT